MFIIKGFEQTDQMGGGGQEHQNVKDLMRATTNVKGTGCEALGYTSLGQSNQQCGIVVTWKRGH